MSDTKYAAFDALTVLIGAETHLASVSMKDILTIDGGIYRLQKARQTMREAGEALGQLCGLIDTHNRDRDERLLRDLGVHDETGNLTDEGRKLLTP